jgi:2-phospho-L-lactate/phosphoenolpyruvate guanylyltransferase
MHAARWTIIIPVKRLSIGKSRLRDAPADDALVLAIALDTIAAARDADVVDRVLVVTPDQSVADAVRRLGAEPVDDHPDAGLNAAITAGADHAGSTVPRAALLADLPALRSAELAVALREAGGTPGRAFVPDHAGTGTTMLVAAPGVGLDPRFGPDSAANHALSGAVALDGDWPSLRLDVDTASDLAAARRLGLGRYTAAVLDGGGLPIELTNAVC